MSRGFTLLEMIVALGVFAIAALISVSSLLALTDAQGKAFAIENSYDNLRFVVEAMAKDLRTGTLYYCGTSPDDIPAIPVSQPCVGGGQSLTYKNAGEEIIAYRILNNKIEKFVDGNLIGAMTSDDLTIEQLVFYVISGSGLQPRITITMRGSAGLGREKSTFNLQTTVSQRQIGTQ